MMEYTKILRYYDLYLHYDIFTIVYEEKGEKIGLYPSISLQHKSVPILE